MKYVAVMTARCESGHMNPDLYETFNANRDEKAIEMAQIIAKDLDSRVWDVTYTLKEVHKIIFSQ